MQTPVRKALTFRASSIGDCLMGKYLLENIHAQFPDARCGIVVGSRAPMLRDLLAAYPWLEVIEANRRSPRSLVSLWKDFRGSDIVVTQYAGKTGGRFSLWSKLAARALAKKGGLIGFADSSRINKMLYDKLVPLSRGAAPAALEREVLSAAGIPVAFDRPTMRSAPNAVAPAAFGLVPRQFVVVHLFAGNKGRGLSPERRRALLVSLAEKLPGIRLAVSGGAADRADALAAAEGLPATVLAGEASLQELMGLIGESRGAISVDTGVAHIAAQLGKPVIVLATCLGLHWWGEGQYGAGVPAALFTCADLCAAGHDFSSFPACLNDIEPETVARKAAVIVGVV